MYTAIRETQAAAEYLTVLRVLVALGATTRGLQMKRHGVWDLYQSNLGANPGLGEEERKQD